MNSGTRMNVNTPQPEFVVVPSQYATMLDESHQVGQQVLEQDGRRELAVCRRFHDQEMARCIYRLDAANAEVAKLKKENSIWRKKAVLYKMKTASSEESSHLVLANLHASENLVKQLTEEKENLLLCNKDLQQQVQSLTTLCQGQHRATVQQQGALANTSAEAEDLQSQLRDATALSELVSQQLADAHAAHAATRGQVDDLRSQLDQQQADLQAQMTAYAALRADFSQLQDTLKENKDALARAEVRSERLSKDLVLREAELHAAEQRLQRHLQNTVQRDELVAQQVKAADAAVIHQQQQCIAQLQEQLEALRRAAEQEQRRLSGKVEQEASLRESLEGQCSQLQQRLREDLSRYNASLGQLRSQLGEKEVNVEALQGKLAALEKLHRQMGEKEAEMEVLQSKVALMEKLRRQVRDQEAQMEVLQEKLAASERKAEARAAQIADLEAALQRSKDSLGQQAVSKEAAVKALQEQLEQQRRTIEQKESLLRDTEAAHVRQMEFLQKRLAEYEVSAREQEARLRQHGEAARQKTAEASTSSAQSQQRLAELETLLRLRDERIRQAEEGRVAESTAHARETELLKKRLADYEASAREQEALLRKKVAESGSSDAQSQRRLTEMEALLRMRDERIRYLEEGHAVETAQRELRARQQRESHEAQVAGLEARLRQLEHQLSMVPSPEDPQQNQVRSAAATVDKLVGNLLGRSQGAAGCTTEPHDDETDDDDRGPSAELLLRLAQPHALLPQGNGGLRMTQELGAAVLPSARPDVPTSGAEAGPSNPAAASAGIGAGRGRGALAAAGKRAQDQPPDVEEQPAGRKGRPRKAAKTTDAAAKVAAASTSDGPSTAEEEAVGDQAAGSHRPNTRRRAAQSAQAKAKAMAAALADGSDAETQAETPAPRGAKAASRAPPRQGRGAGAAAATAEADKEDADGDKAGTGGLDPPASSVPPAAQEAAKPPAPKRRTRSAKNGQAKGTDESQPELPVPGVTVPASGPPAPEPSQPEAAATHRSKDVDAQAMPPPPRPTGRPRGVAPAADLVAATQESEKLGEEPTQFPSQPATQPQPPVPEPQPARTFSQGEDLISSVGLVPNPPPRPTSSQVSIFSQGLKPYESLMAKNPLAAINHRIIEQAKSRVRLVPYAALQQLKPMTKILPPSMAKDMPSAQGAAVKRPLPSGGGSGAGAAPEGVIPTDVVLRSLQPQPSKVARTGQ